jgi:hypothetical protein
MAVFLFSAIAMIAIIYGIFWLVSVEHEYIALGLPWYKRPAAFWGCLIAICTLVMVAQ